MSNRKISSRYGRMLINCLAVSSALAVTLVAEFAQATNFQVPAGVKGTLVFANTRFSDGGTTLVPAEFGLVQRNAAGEPSYTRLTLNYADSPSSPFYRVPVSGGEVFEMYLRRNAAGTDPNITPETFSSDPTKNTSLDPTSPEHATYSTFPGLPNYWALYFDEVNHTSDGTGSESEWAPYSIQEAFFYIWIEPTCDDVTIMCPDPNLIVSNHGVGIPAVGRNLFKAVQNVTAALGPIVASAQNTAQQDQYTCVNARIDNNTWGFVQESTDFAVQAEDRQDGACAPTDGEDFSGPHFLKQLAIKRYHRPKFEFMQSAFGIGAFSEFDMNLTIYPGANGTETEVVLFDPRSDAPPISFFETSTADGDSSVDGVYHDRATHAYKTMIFYNTSGLQEPNPRNANFVRVTKWNGESFGFEIINLQTGTNTPPSLSARLRDLRDRSNNAYLLSYTYAATTSDAGLNNDRTLLWEISQVTDMEGATANFTWVPGINNNRKLVNAVTWTDGTTVRQLSYQYTVLNPVEAPDRLIVITYPNGDTSSFGNSWDATTQTWALGYSDVAGAGNGQNDITAYVTGSYYVTSDGVTHNQPAGLIRRVVNANGELTYKNWEDPRDNKTTYFAEGSGGTGSRLTRIKTNAAGATLEVARAPFPTATTDPLTATFTVHASYVPNSFGLATSIVNALNQATSVVRGAVSGVISGITSAGGQATSTTVDANQKVTREVDAAGIVTVMTYDTADNLLTTTTASGTPRAQTWAYTYNSRGLMMSVTNPLGVVTNYAYDTTGHLLSLTDPADVTGGTRPVRAYVYDNLGRRVKETDQAGRPTTIGYDARGRQVTMTYADATTDQNIFGSGAQAGMLYAQLDRNGVSRALLYDSTNRVTTKIQSGNNQLSLRQDFVSYFPGRYLASSENIDGTRKDSAIDIEDRTTQTTIYATNTKTLAYQKAYDAASDLIMETDPYNRKTYYVYDANQRITRQATEMVPSAIAAGANIATLARVTTANPSYVVEDRTYDADGRMTSRTDELGNKTTYTFDELGRQTQKVEASGTTSARTTTYAYDAANNKSSEVGPRATTAYTYTRRDLLASKTVASGKTEAATTRQTYTLTGALATVTDGRGGVTTYTYGTKADVVTSVKDPLGFVTSYTYDPLGNILTTTDPNGLTTTLTYDGRYRETKRTDGLNEASFTDYDDNASDNGGTSFTYASLIAPLGLGANANGHLARHADPTLDPYVEVVDGAGRKVLSVDPLMNPTVTSYDTLTNGLAEVKITNALGKVTVKRQDARGNTRQEVDADGNVTNNSYDATGHVLSERDPNNVGMDCVYNPLGQRTSCTDTLGEKTTWVPDADGNITSMTDPLLNVTTCQFDGRDRKTSCIDRMGAVRTFTYDANSNLLTMKDAQAGTTTYTYDARNMQTSAVYPDSATDKVTSTYDAGGRLLSTVDQSGNSVSATYDAANRLTKTTYPDGLNDTYVYDTASRLTSAASARYGVTTSRTYDANGRIATETTGIGGQNYLVMSFYDALNRLTTLQYPDASQIIQSYSLNRDLLTESKLNGTFSVAKYAYDAASRPTTTTFGNALVETRTYRTSDNRISQLSTGQVGTLTYTYDKNGNRLTEAGTAAEGNQAFTYDKEDRVSSWTAPSLTQSWVLSAEADWTSTTRSGVVENRTYNAAHALTAVAGVALTYDPRGNLTKDNKSNNLLWDFSNRLKEYQKSGGPTVDFLYDALGRRVGRKSGTTTVAYIFSQDQMIAEYTNNVLAKDYYYGAGTDNLIAYQSGGSLFWYSKDYLNTVKAVTNEGGVVSERYRYTAYGERTILSSTGAVISATTVNNFFGFTGRPHDIDTGLIDFRARQYEPHLGRFISRDSAGYVNGASLYRGYFVPNGTDPSGHSWLSSAWDATGGKVVHAVETVTNVVVHAAETTASAIAGLAGDVGDAVWDTTKFLGTELWSGIDYVGNLAWTKAQSIWDKAVLTWNEAENLASLIQEGAGIAWNGITWGASKAWSYASSRAGFAAIVGAVITIGGSAVLAAFGVPPPINGMIAGFLGNLVEDAIDGRVTWQRFITRDLIWGSLTGGISAEISPFKGVSFTQGLSLIWSHPIVLIAPALVFTIKLELDHYIDPALGPDPSAA